MSVMVNLTGLDSVKKMLEKADVALTKGLSDEINASALKIESDAKKNAPVNFGQLRNSIRLIKVSDLTYSVAATASYAPYVEFGTGGLVNVPAGLENYADRKSVV